MTIKKIFTQPATQYHVTCLVSTTLKIFYLEKILKNPDSRSQGLENQNFNSLVYIKSVLSYQIPFLR